MMEFKTLPNNKELERVILGAILIQGGSFEGVSSILHEDYFYNPIYKTIFQCVKKSYDNGKSIDMVIVQHEIMKQKKDIPIDILIGCTEGVYSSANLLDWAVLLRDIALRRIFIERFTSKIEQAYKDDAKIDDILINAENETQQLYKNFAGEARFSSVYEEVCKSANRLSERIKIYEENGKIGGISSGLKEFDNIINGWHSGELIILAARPAMGKTAVMLHFAKSAANNGKNALIFSLEMSAESLADRFLLSESDVEITSSMFQSGNLSEYHKEPIFKGVENYHNKGLWIDDNPDVSMDYIFSKSKVMKDKQLCDLILIDYLQLIKETTNSIRSREQAVSAISRQAKIISKKLNVPVIMLSQLSRSVEARADKLPMLSDLRDSGAIEQDADKVIFIYRPSYYAAEDDFTIPKDEGKLIVAKNRQGRCGEVKFKHNETLTKIFNI